VNIHGLTDTSATMSYSTSKYLIYGCFESKASVSESKICGSILLDYAETEDEANEKIAMYKARSYNFDRTVTSSSTSRYTYILNRSEWWSRVRGRIGQAG
jgi:hypothetical protein